MSSCWQRLMIRFCIDFFFNGNNLNSFSANLIMDKGTHKVTNHTLIIKLLQTRGLNTLIDFLNIKH